MPTHYNPLMTSYLFGTTPEEGPQRAKKSDWSSVRDRLRRGEKLPYGEQWQQKTFVGPPEPFEQTVTEGATTQRFRGGVPEGELELPTGARPGQLSGAEFARGMNAGGFGGDLSKVNLSDLERYIRFGTSSQLGADAPQRQQERLQALGSFLGMAELGQKEQIAQRAEREEERRHKERLGARQEAEKEMRSRFAEQFYQENLRQYGADVARAMTEKEYPDVKLPFPKSSTPPKKSDALPKGEKTEGGEANRFYFDPAAMRRVLPEGPAKEEVIKEIAPDRKRFDVKKFAEKVRPIVGTQDYSEGLIRQLLRETNLPQETIQDALSTYLIGLGRAGYKPEGFSIETPVTRFSSELDPEISLATDIPSTPWSTLRVPGVTPYQYHSSAIPQVTDQDLNLARSAMPALLQALRIAAEAGAAR